MYWLLGREIYLIRGFNQIRTNTWQFSELQKQLFGFDSNELNNKIRTVSWIKSYMNNNNNNLGVE